MSRTAFQRDIDDPKTIHDFVEVVQSLERLRLLLVLTVADIRAVGPTVWNALEGGAAARALLRDRGGAVRRPCRGGARASRRRGQGGAHRTAAPSRLGRGAHRQPDRALPAILLAGLRRRRRSSTRPSWCAQADRGGEKLAIATRLDSYRGVTEVTVYTADHPGLFSRIAGGIALARANIVEAKIFTLTNGMALDTFLVQDASGGAIGRKDQIDRLT